MSSIEKKYMKLQTPWHLISRLSLDSKAVEVLQDWVGFVIL